MLAVLYLIPALNLAGIPPLSGFFGKVGLIQASASRGLAIDWWLIGAGVVTSLLTLYAVTRAWTMMFWQEAPHELPEKTIPRAMIISTATLVAVTIGISLGAGPLGRYTWDAASELHQRTPYISAVLPDEERGTGQSSEVTEEKEAQR